MSETYQNMEDSEVPKEERDKTDESASTLIVPPPDFKERLAAAQRARELQARRAMQFKTPPENSVESELRHDDREPS